MNLLYTKAILYSYSNLEEVMTYVYNLEKGDEQARKLTAYSILKSNPWMADVVLDENQETYGNGDVTNIPYEVIKKTDFFKDETLKTVHLPDVTLFEEMRNDRDSVFVGSTTFYPAQDLEDNQAIVRCMLFPLPPALRCVQSQDPQGYSYIRF